MSNGPEWITVCQSSACLYRAIPAVDVWEREPGVLYYLCAECSIALGPRLRALHYHWSQLEPKDAAEATLAKEYGIER